MFMETVKNIVISLIFMWGTLFLTAILCIINYLLINFVLNHFELEAEFIKFINRKRK